MMGISKQKLLKLWGTSCMRLRKSINYKPKGEQGLIDRSYHGTADRPEPWFKFRTMQIELTLRCENVKDGITLDLRCVGPGKSPHACSGDARAYDFEQCPSDSFGWAVICQKAYMCLSVKR